MRRFLIKMGIFLAIQIAGVLYYVPSLWSGDPHHYMATLQDKATLLAKTDEHDRVILVGGSNTAWGLSAADLGHELGRPAVNTGLHAALGLDVILDLPAAYIRTGDIVVLTLEYEHYVEETKHDETIWTSTPYFKDLPVHPKSFQPVYLADHFFEYVTTARDHFVNLEKAAKRNSEEIFTRGSFDDRGDMITQYALPPAMSVADLHFSMGMPTVEAMAPFLAKINQFIAGAEARGAKVYVYFPPLPQRKFEFYKTQLLALEANVRAGVHCPVLNHPGDLTMDDKDFYNTVYHLTKPGVDRRTKDLAAVLKTALAAEPAKPAGK